MPTASMRDVDMNTTPTGVMVQRTLVARERLVLGVGLDARWGQVGHSDMVSRHSSLEPGAEDWCQAGSRCPIEPTCPNPVSTQLSGDAGD